MKTTEIDLYYKYKLHWAMSLYSFEKLLKELKNENNR